MPTVLSSPSALNSAVKLTLAYLFLTIIMLHRDRNSLLPFQGKLIIFTFLALKTGFISPGRAPVQLLQCCSCLCLSVIVTAKKKKSLKLRIQIHFVKSSHGLSTMDGLSQICNNVCVAICFIEFCLYIVLFYVLCGPC